MVISFQTYLPYDKGMINFEIIVTSHAEKQSEEKPMAKEDLVDYSVIKLQINVIYRNFNAKLFTIDNERKEIHSTRGMV